MENGDLKRYYKVNNQEAKDFVRLNADGKIPPELIDGGGTAVVANPTGEATADLTKLQVDTTIYGIATGTEVIANPTLAGTEDALTGLQVGDTKYAVKKVYHTYTFKTYTPSDTDYAQLVEDLTLGREILAGNHLYYMVAHPTTTLWRYSSMMSDGGVNNQYPCYLLTIEKSGDDYQIYSPVSASISSISVSPNPIDYNFRPTLMMGGTSYALVGTQVAFRTTAPTADNTSGYLGIVKLTSEPAQRYNGWWYIITSSTT